ncbi:hypothetical protein GGR88_000747 [Sphingomonas jejuensis]|uniref:Peptidase M14 domain-containing protein n=1 Tax=Sphingomonas jejuensis TaxID=904715 RepID=A0ABX0XIV7_9SPHN|nr:M14 family metallopeptidase [Sphingomonas jejuensis]NJC33273.1 hypothetical protein [Sphingomonas jejuensis]
MILATMLFAAQAAVPPAPALPMAAPLPPALPWSGRSEGLIARPDDPWITPAERARFEATPNLADSYAWLQRLDAASDLVSIERIGTSPEGRPLIAVTARKGSAAKPVVLIQAGIHAGEIDGKDAGMMLLRDIALRGKDGLLDDATFVFVPVFNVDGHERSSRWSRPNQRGPREQGWRTTAQNLNLNRDYLKADAPEMQAMIALIRRLDPALYIDVHVTDGIDYQYDITYGFNGWGGEDAYSPAIARWMDGRLRPAFDRALIRGGHIPGPLIFATDDRDPAVGLSAGPSSGRFSQGYGDLRHMPSILVENHSLKPYRQRVLGTYVLMEEALRLVGAERSAVQRAVAEDRAARPTEMSHGWQAEEQPTTRRWRGVAWERYRSAASGRDEIRWLGQARDGEIASTGQRFAPAAPLPSAWWVPATKPDLIAVLRLHGVEMTEAAGSTALDLDMVRLPLARLSQRASEGRVPMNVGEGRHERRRVVMPPGSVRVPADQPLGLVAAALLEPDSRESLLAWGAFPEILERTEYIEGYAIAPLADRMLEADPALRAAFEERIAADPAFAADGDARLAWFYARTPYYDDRYLLYPVGRETVER